jgi:hypothetical protein
LVVPLPVAGDLAGLATFGVNHSLTVTNVGTRTSDVVALAFVVATAGSPDGTPLRKLFGFERLRAVAPVIVLARFFSCSGRLAPFRCGCLLVRRRC